MCEGSLANKELFMADSIKVALEKRSVTGKKVKHLRQQGLLPATVYGKGVGPFTVQLPQKAFQELIRKAGRTRIVELSIPGESMISAFVHALQRHPVTRDIIHVDFHAVDLKVEVTISVPIHIVGTSVLVGRGDALLNQAMSSIDVSALPTALPASIDVDISGLDAFDKSIHVRDLVAPAGSAFAADGDDLVVSLTPARAEEEITEEASAEPELIREKREDEE
jgi:large subunit ribosomal protein L25